MDGEKNIRRGFELPPQEETKEREEEKSLRPLRLADFNGQTEIKSKLEVYIQAAKKREETLDHILFYGPPGLGKTTLANIIAHEMESELRITTGPALEKPGDLAAILSNLQERDVLFIDEIHRMSTSIEEVLYSAMEHCRQRSARTQHLPEPAALYAGGSDNSSRTSECASARALWHC